MFIFLYFYIFSFFLISIKKRTPEADLTPTFLFLYTFSSDLGKYGKSKGICNDCPTGWYSDSKAAEECTKCELGDLDNGASKSCSSCDLGKYGSKEGVCETCPAGYFQDTKGETSCQECPVDTYLSEQGKSSKADCQKCSNERTTNKIQGVTSSSICVCRAGQPKATEEKERRGYYVQEDQCITCPSGASCNISGANLTFIQTVINLFLFFLFFFLNKMFIFKNINSVDLLTH